MKVKLLSSDLYRHALGDQIVICPIFFTVGLPALRPSINCMPVNIFINRFLGNGAKISYFQFWILLEVAHHYTNAGKGNAVDVDVDDINKCAGLSAQASMSNANTYLFHVASKNILSSANGD